MSEATNIEWADSTFNPWMGCTKISPACDHCYAERDTKRFGRVKWGSGKPRVRTSAANWKLPERWNRAPFYQCKECGWRGEGWLCGNTGPGALGCITEAEPTRRRVFCASLADWLDNEVPIEWLIDLLDLVRRTPNLDWLLLTKRIGNFERLVTAALVCSSTNEPLRAWIVDWLSNGYPPRNVWLGSTVVNQAEADRDVPKLLAVPARVRFLSIGPMLGPIDLTAIKHTQSPGYFGDCLQWYHQPNGASPWRGIDWIICEGESGPQARPMHPDWARGLRDQCTAAGVPFLFKQWGEWAEDEAAGLPTNLDLKVTALNVDGTEPKEIGEDSTDWVLLSRHGKKAAGRLLDGVEHNGFPGERS